MQKLFSRLCFVYLLACVASAQAADPAAATTAGTNTAKPANAAPGKTTATTNTAAASATAKNDSGLVTNVVGSQEAPTVLNVVPWKDKDVKLEKKNPTTSILNQVLQPLDRDVLKREVQYFRSLQEQKTP